MYFYGYICDNVILLIIYEVTVKEWNINIQLE
jgi:hypothetical protein